MTRRDIQIPDELWAEINRGAARETLETVGNKEDATGLPNRWRLTVAARRDRRNGANSD